MSMFLGLGAIPSLQPSTVGAAATPSTLLDGLEWRLPFTDDTLDDASGEGNDATAIGTIAYTTDAERGRVLDLRASTAIGALAGIGIPSGASYTKACWVKMPDVTGNHNFMSSDEGTQEHIGWLTGGTLALKHNATTYANRAAAFVNDEWAHVVFTYDAATTTSRVYMNGVLLNENTSSGATNATVGNQIGLWNGGFGLGGYMSDPRFYLRAITAAEVTELFTTERAAATPPPVMPLGDSIVRGLPAVTEIGWRLGVRNQADGDTPAVPFNFVGPLGGGAFADDQHAGYSGNTIAQIRTQWNTSAFLYTPRVVILMCGTNDVSGLDATGAEIVDRLELLVDDLEASSVEQVLVCSIAPRNPAQSFATITNDYNAGLPAMLASKTKSTFVDASGTMVYATHIDPDQIHPNPAGYTVQGNVIYPALKTALAAL